MSKKRARKGGQSATRVGRRLKPGGGAAAALAACVALAATAAALWAPAPPAPAPAATPAPAARQASLPLSKEYIYAGGRLVATEGVAKLTPVVTWNDPPDIAHGTALGPAQLNATADVPGTFSYSPPAGTVLGVGNDQQLSVTFTPADTAVYNNATAGVRINVIGCASAESSTFAATSPVPLGKSSWLTWNVPYAAVVTIDGVAGSFGTSGSTYARPTANTTYTLRAESAPICQRPGFTKQASVVVLPCPTAGQTTFTADSYLLPPGGSVLLSWSAPDATEIHIFGTTACAPSQICTTPVYSGAAPSGSVSVSPTMTTTYVMWAMNNTNNCDQVEKQLTVETANASCSPGAYFSQGMLPPGEYAEPFAVLEWSVPNATSVTIKDQTGADYGTYGPSGQIYVGTRFMTRTYALSAQIAGPSCTPFVLYTTVECSMDCSGSSSSD